ncbi:hypothetical protein D8676_01010 [Mesorhizobium sp. YM1C-6-2]|nr:hypothetical protein D8676_01010 [Mesorhizobium sp. YM1C-6-2]
MVVQAEVGFVEQVQVVGLDRLVLRRCRHRILGGQLGLRREGVAEIHVYVGHRGVEIGIGGGHRLDRRCRLRGFDIERADIVVRQAEIEIPVVGLEGFGGSGLRRFGIQRLDIVIGETEIEFRVVFSSAALLTGGGQSGLEIGREVEIYLGDIRANIAGLGRGFQGGRLDGEIGGFHREIMRGLLIVEREFAKQFLFQIQTEIVFLDGLFDRSSLLSGRFLRLRRGPRRLARVETHDSGQFRKGIVVRQVDMIGDF